MRMLLSAAAALLLASGPALAAKSVDSVFDIDAARTFCTAGAADGVEECLSDQEKAAQRIDYWLYRGDLPRYLSKRAYAGCDAFYGPDLRQVLICIEDGEDDRRNGRGFLSRRGITFGR